MAKKDVKERKLERELLWVIGFLGLLVLIFLAASAYFRSAHTFTYEGLTFTKEKFGELPVYHYSYFFENKRGALIKYNLYLQTDPRENMIPVEGDTIVFDRAQVFLTFDPDGLEQCPKSFAGIFDLARFLTENDLTVKNGIMDYGHSILLNQTYVTCETKPDSDVIEIFRGNGTTSITIDGNCHRIEVGNQCDIFEAVEKLKLQSVLDARDDGSSGNAL